MIHNTACDDQAHGTSRSTSLSRRDLLTRAAIGVATVAARAVPSVLPAGAAAPATHAARKTLTIGAKGFAENEIVAHMYLLLLQQAGVPVHGTITQNLTSAIATTALMRGDIDIFPEYTGTGLEVILKHTEPHNAHAYYKAVAAGYQRQFNLTWLDP